MRFIGAGGAVGSQSGAIAIFIFTLVVIVGAFSFAYHS